MSAQLAGAEVTPALNITSKPDSSENKAKKSDALKDGGFILGLLIAVACLFYKTLFLGLPISRIARLATWDSAFAQYNSGTSALMDPSVVQLTVPYFMMVAKIWHSLQVPFWNPYNACGVPLLADPQAFVLSPLHVLMAIWPSMRCYNNVLVAEIADGAVSAYVLARSLSVSRWSAVLAALAFAFCPLNLWFLEQLGNGYMLFPLIFWLFVRASLKPTILRAAAAGAGCALLVLSGHPESVFFGTAFGALLTVALVLFNACELTQTATKRFLLALRQVAIAALVAGCLSAPLLVPFFEYLKNADCYKFGANAAAQIPWQLLFLNLLQPTLGGASLYLGVLPILCLPFCFIGAQRKERSILSALAVVALVSEAFTSQLWPIGPLLARTPLASLIPNYCQPIPLLIVALLGAIGFNRLIEARRSTLTRDMVVLVATAIFALTVPLVVNAVHAPLSSLAFDSSLTNVGLNLRDWRLAAVLTAGVLALMSLRRFCSARLAVVPIALMVALSLFGQFTIARHALPVNPAFAYGPTPITDELSKASSERYITIGDHLLKPNNNSVYGLSDLRIHNPMFPAGYRDLVSVCGANIDQFNQTFTPPLSPSLGIASIQHVASQGPVWSAGLTDKLAMRSVTNPCRWADAELTGFSSGYDIGNRQLIGKMHWHFLQPANISELVYSVALFDKGGTMIWFSDSQPFPAPPASRKKGAPAVGSPRDFEHDFAVAVPSSLKSDAEPLTVGLQLFNWKTLKFIQPIGGKVLQGHVCQLLSFDPRDNAHGQTITDPTFALEREVSPSLRFYRNERSLPDAYIIHAVQAAASPSDALAEVGKKDFAFRTRAVFETNSPDELALLGADPGRQLVAIPEPAGSITRPNPDTVEIHTGSGANRALVLTDTYYPGWQATVDGKVVPIYRANGYFRGILLPSGTHDVQFRYHPRSFQIGLALAAAMAALLIAAATIAALNSGAAGKRSEDTLAAQ